MLDWAHRLVLRAVAAGDDDPESPALDNLLATGLVARRAGGEGYEVTPAGRAALEAGEPGRGERRFQTVALTVLGICGAIILVGWIVDLLA
jgi:hypothetical protein